MFYSLNKIVKKFCYVQWIFLILRLVANNVHGKVNWEHGHKRSNILDKITSNASCLQFNQLISKETVNKIYLNKPWILISYSCTILGLSPLQMLPKRSLYKNKMIMNIQPYYINEYRSMHHLKWMISDLNKIK